MSVLDDPLVSVIVPVHNRRHCVMEAVASVLAQTHPRVECIVVDDGSVDGSGEAVTAAAAACGADATQVRVFVQEHRGVSAARNRGLAEARGEYVTFLDSDDVMPPGRIRRQLELLGAGACDAVLGRYESMLMPGVAPPSWMALRPDWCRGYAWITLLAARSQLGAVGGFDETLSLAEDADLVVRMREAGLRTSVVDEVFVLRRIFGDNLTYGLDARRSSMLDVVRRSVARRRDQNLGVDVR